LNQGQAQAGKDFWEPFMRWRFFWRLVVGVALPLVVGLVATTAKLWVQRKQADGAVQLQVANLNEIDPSWTFEEMEAKRKPLAPGKNGAMLVLEIAREIPKGWPSWNHPQKEHAPFQPGNDDVEIGERERQSIADELNSLGLRHAPSTPAANLLEMEMARVAKALTKARELVRYPAGRYLFDFQLDWPNTIVGDLQKGREVAGLLELQAVQLSQRGKTDEACEAALGIYHVGKSYGLPDTLIAQLIRITVMSMAARATERALSLGEARKETVARLQERFEKEDQETPALMLHAARSERALTHRMMEALWDGRISLKQLEFSRLEADSWWDRFALNFGMAPFRQQQADFLRETTAEIETWKKPWAPTQADNLAPQGQEAQKWYRIIVEGLQRVKHAGAQTQALMRCAAVAMAVERFRLDNGQWPKSLEELTPAYVEEIPVDPYGAGLIRMVRNADNLIIFSVWKDGIDDHGNLDKTGLGAAGTDFGFQLWDPNARKAVAPKAR
jgi:hypothetical protein